MNRIREFRENKNMSSDELADAVRVHPLADKGMRRTRGQTITRIEKGKMQLTERWLNIIAQILVIDPRELLIPTLEPEADGIAEAKSDNARALAMKDLRVVLATGNMLQELGIQPSQPLTVDCSDAAIAAKETGDVVLVSIRNAALRTDKGIQTLRQFVAPSLVVTNRRGVNLAYHLSDKSIRIHILGVVLRDWD